jgi:uncharacterized membrane protein
MSREFARSRTMTHEQIAPIVVALFALMLIVVVPVFAMVMAYVIIKSNKKG